jgi:hypothetical protein
VFPLAALLSSGYLATYLLPTLVGRLSTDFALSATQAGAVGSLLLLASALTGTALAGRVHAVGPERLARISLLALVGGFSLAAAAPIGDLPVLVAGCVVGGSGSGAAVSVAASCIAAERDPHRVTVLGLLVASTVAGALYLTLPHLGGGHRLPFACIAAWGAFALLFTGRLTVERDSWEGPRALAPGRVRGPVSGRSFGLVLAGGLMLWSMAQNALWGVSGRIGLERAGLSETAVGLVFALALGAGLVGTVAAGALGGRFGRALPIGLGTAVIAGCVVLSGCARSAGAFAVGEIAWNTVYPFVLSYLLSLAARLDRGGRLAVLVGSASSLGVACGPLAGTLLTVHAGFTAMGLVLGGALLLVAFPLAVVARHTDEADRAVSGVLPPAPAEPGAGAAAGAAAGARSTARSATRAAA